MEIYKFEGPLKQSEHIVLNVHQAQSERLDCVQLLTVHYISSGSARIHLQNEETTEEMHRRLPSGGLR